MRESIGIVILNYNTYDETLKCVDSIRINTTYPFHIYIVDNASRDQSGERLQERYKKDRDVSIIINTNNTGYSAGNNIGIRRAVDEGRKYIAIINSDVELLNNALDILIETLEDDNEIMMIGPSVMDNNKQESQILRKKLTFRTFILDRHPFCDILRRGKEADRYYIFSNHGITKEDASVSGCCFCMRTCDFMEIGYFDENVFLYCEEDILAYKMTKKNKKAAVNADAKVWHKANISTSKEGNAFVQFHRWTSVLYMLKTYAHISKLKQRFIALWNIITWDILSLISKSHRKMNREFRRKNWAIVNTDNLG